MFFKKKQSQEILTTVNPLVGAELVPVDGMPDLKNAVATSGDSLECTRMRVSMAKPGELLIEDPGASIPKSAFVISNPSDSQTLAMVNDAAEGRFGVWTIASPDDLKLVSQMTTQPLSADQDSWADYTIINAACLPDGRTLIAVNYYQSGPKNALYLFDPSDLSFELLSRVNEYIGAVDQFFECRALSADSALLVYYTGRTRAAPEIYHNHYNHLVLFSPGHVDGVEVIKLGIETGNVQEWAVVDQTLFLHTSDRRNPEQYRESFWSLDLSSLTGG